MYLQWGFESSIPPSKKNIYNIDHFNFVYLFTSLINTITTFFFIIQVIKLHYVDDVCVYIHILYTHKLSNGHSRYLIK